ncbi:MAG TPA: hypothetical protein VIJ75_00405 [Hanamia sp.]
MILEIQLQPENKMFILINGKEYLADNAERALLIKQIGLGQLRIENVMSPPSMPIELFDWIGGAHFTYYPVVDISHLSDKFIIDKRITLKT